MFDRLRLRDNILMIIVLAILASWVLDSKQVGQIFMMVAMLLTALYCSLRPTIIPKNVRNIFQDQFSAMEVDERIKGDAEFSQALQYVYNLGSKDFIRFMRLTVELRDQANQRGLKDMRDLLVKADKE